MEKVYHFDWNKYGEKLTQIYPMEGKHQYIDFSKLTKENLGKLKETFYDVVTNPVLTVKEFSEKEKEEITCLPEQTKQIFDELFSNEDLTIYGHGGNAEAIINSEGLICEYANLSSHFIPLIKTNESLSRLNNWPHKEASQIAILAINETEYNPIYKERVPMSNMDREIYTLPSEYFVGYYDNVKKQFTLNQNFKVSHEYNPELTRFADGDTYTYSLPGNGDEVINEFFENLYEIQNILIHASRKNLSETGYLNVVKRVSIHMQTAEMLTSKLTRKYLAELKTKQEEKIKMEEAEYDDEWKNEDAEWNFDTEWDVGEETKGQR